jgi:hypothetical protein
MSYAMKQLKVAKHQQFGVGDSLLYFFLCCWRRTLRSLQGLAITTTAAKVVFERVQRVRS